MNGQNGLKNIFRSLKYGNFRIFFGGQSISLIGTWMQMTAMPWLVYDLTHSVILLGIVGFAGQIPILIISPFAGVMSDRWNRYHLLIITQTLAMTQAFILAILVFTNLVQVWHILVLSGLLGCINAFDMPNRQSFIAKLVENKDDMGNAIALNSVIVNGAKIIGPSVAGALIATTGEGMCFLINGFTYMTVIISLFFMKINYVKIVKQKEQVLKELKNGFSYAYRYAPIKYVLLLLCLVSLMSMPYSILMPIFAKDILHGSSHTFGFLMGASGVGAMAGALYLASRKNIDGLLKIIPVSAALFGLGLILFSASRNIILSMFLMVFTGLWMMLQMASSNTLIQTIVDDDKRGRVMSLYTIAFFGAAPLGSFLSGVIAKYLGAPETIMIGGISCIAGGILFATKEKMLIASLIKS